MSEQDTEKLIIDLLNAMWTRCFKCHNYHAFFLPNIEPDCKKCEALKEFKSCFKKPATSTQHETKEGQ